MVRSLAPAPSTRTVARGAGAVSIAEPKPAPPVERAEKSRFANAIERGAFVLSVELVPPKGYRCEEVIEQARQLRIQGVDAVAIRDDARAAARMSAVSVAVLVEQRAGMETILHYACRDRNLLGMQSDLLGAHAMGIRNLLIVTGEPLTRSDYPDATAVFDVDSIGLTNVVARLNQGLDIGGQEIGRPTAFHVGVAANPAAVNLDQEIRRFAYKVEAGAEFAVTQPIFDLGAVEAFLKRIEGFRIPIVAGLYPFESLRNAEFMANEVPGVRVPAGHLDRMRRAASAEAARAEGVAIAREIAEGLRGAVQGVQISSASEELDSVLAVIDACEWLKPRSAV